MKRYIRLTLIGEGGEYYYGTAIGEEEKKAIRKLIDTKELLINSTVDNLDIALFNYDQLFHCFGPDINKLMLNIEEFLDKNCEENRNEILYNKDFEELDEDSQPNLFEISTPYVNEEYKAKYAKDDLLIGAFSVEKNIYFPIVIELDEAEEFNIKNVFIGYTAMHATLLDDEIITDAFYIRKELQEELTNDYQKDDTFEYMFGDILHEIFNENHLEESKEKVERCRCIISDVEGQGWSKGEFIMVSDMNNEQLYLKEY
jgi:hypothetical protein